MNENCKNYALLCGRVASLEEGHNVPDGTMQNGIIETRRQSGVIDSIPFQLHSNKTKNLKVGENIKLMGQFHSYDDKDAGKLKVYVQGKTFEYVDDDLNNIELDGYICTQPYYKKTAGGREIAEFILANNQGNKSYYLPCICWGDNAAYIKQQNVGCKISLFGRLQSRAYPIKSDGSVTGYGTSYEVSIFSLRRIETS